MGLFFLRGQSAARWLPTVASASAGPTLAEWTAGTDLTPAITALAGWETSLNRINTAVMNAKEELQTNGPQTLGDASITLLDDDGQAASGSTQRVAAKTALAEGTNGYFGVCTFKAAPTTADKIYLFPALVGAVNPDLSLDAQLSRLIVQMAITGAPRKNVAIS